MKKTKSVFKPLFFGQLLINLPCVLFSIGTPLLIFELIGGIDNFLKLFIVFLGFFGGMGIACLWWIFGITKWRIWAFKRTDEESWTKLKRKAIEGKLIWPDGASFEKREIRNTKEHREIEKIKIRINELQQAELVEWNKIIPDEINYKLSQFDLRFTFILKSVLIIIFIGSSFVAHY